MDPHDELQRTEAVTKQLQTQFTPQQALELLEAGNRRFRAGERMPRDFAKQVGATAAGQHPLAVVLSCIDSRVPAEIVFDLGIGDAFSVRVAGNVIGTKSLGSIEYGVISGVKLLVVLGHTRCGAVTSALQLAAEKKDAQQATGCAHLNPILGEITESVDDADLQRFAAMSAAEQESFIDEVARRNVARTAAEIVSRSDAIRAAVDGGKVKVVGALYDVKNGEVEFLTG